MTSQQIELIKNMAIKAEEKKVENMYPETPEQDKINKEKGIVQEDLLIENSKEEQDVEERQ